MRNAKKACSAEALGEVLGNFNVTLSVACSRPHAEASDLQDPYQPRFRTNWQGVPNQWNHRGAD